MSGFMGFGQSGGEKKSTAGIDSIFNYALPSAKASNTAGTGALSSASDTFQSLISPGRAGAAINAAPAVNAAKSQSDAARAEEAATGTSRGGGTASTNREAGATAQKNIDDIINQNLFGGKVAGAEGEAKIGAGEQANAAQLLGIANAGQETEYTGAINKEGAQGADFSRIISSLI